jgi:hypothetical protein
VHHFVRYTLVTLIPVEFMMNAPNTPDTRSMQAPVMGMRGNSENLAALTATSPKEQGPRPILNENKQDKPKEPLSNAPLGNLKKCQRPHGSFQQVATCKSKAPANLLAGASLFIRRPGLSPAYLTNLPEQQPGS